MPRDPIAAGALDLTSAWEKEAEERERRAPGVPDPVAATLKTNATELRSRIEQIERDTAYQSVAEYSADNSASESTVRRLCAAGMIAGAVKSAADDWQIPRGAKRLARPKAVAS